MKRTTRKAILGAATFATVTAALTGLTATSAAATNEVPCNSDEFVRITVHATDGPSTDACYANGGELGFDNSSTRKWVTKIWTGNNRVQWRGDGRWQPDQPIGKTTTFTWPNNPGGVDITGIRIV